MSALERLLACVGNWRGSNRLHDPHTGVPEDSASTLTVTPLLDASFVRIDYQWGYQGTPQQGSMLVGYRPDAELVTAHWIDTWHMGREVMACEGPVVDKGAVVVQGSYPVPPGPDWGWRIEIMPTAGQALGIVMVNAAPDGEETVAVEANYEPA